MNDICAHCGQTPEASTESLIDNQIVSLCIEPSSMDCRRLVSEGHLLGCSECFAVGMFLAVTLHLPGCFWREMPTELREHYPTHVRCAPWCRAHRIEQAAVYAELPLVRVLRQADDVLSGPIPIIPSPPRPAPVVSLALRSVLSA